MYPAHDIPQKLRNIRGDYNIQQPRLPPNNVGRPVRQFKCSLAWLKWRTGSPLVRYCFLVRGGGGGGVTDMGHLRRISQTYMSDTDL